MLPQAPLGEERMNLPVAWAKYMQDVEEVRQMFLAEPIPYAALSSRKADTSHYTLLYFRLDKGIRVVEWDDVFTCMLR